MLIVSRLTRSLFCLSRHINIPKVSFGAKKDDKTPKKEKKEKKPKKEAKNQFEDQMVPVFEEEGDDFGSDDDGYVEDSAVGSTLQADQFMEEFELEDVTFVQMLRDLEYDEELEDMDLSHRITEALDTFDFLSSSPQQLLKEYKERHKPGAVKNMTRSVPLQVKDEQGRKIIHPKYLDIKTGKLKPVEQPLSKTEWRAKYGRQYSIQDIQKLKIIQELVFSTLDPDETKKVKEYLAKRQKEMLKQKQKNKWVPQAPQVIEARKKAMQEEEEEEEEVSFSRDEGEVKTTNENNIRTGSKLYEKFIQTQERPMLTKDNYQLNLGLILHRLPIFLPYRADIVKAYKQRYELLRRAGYNNPAIPELAGQLSNPQLEIEVPNADNFITHFKQGKDREMYAENSKYWKFVDPNIQDPTSIQYRSSEMVYFIVKNEHGIWTLPDWPVKQKQTLESMRKGIAEEITGNQNPHFHWVSNLPCFVHKREIEGLERGIGIKTFYFQAAHVHGVFERNPSKRRMWKEYRWVPKGELAKYFPQDYFNTIIRSVQCVM